MDAKGSRQHPKREETRPSPRRKFGRSTSGASHLRPATRSKRTGRSRRTLYASRASPSPLSNHLELEHARCKSPEASYPYETDRPTPEGLVCFACVPSSPWPLRGCTKRSGHQASHGTQNVTAPELMSFLPKLAISISAFPDCSALDRQDWAWDAEVLYPSPATWANLRTNVRAAEPGRPSASSTKGVARE